MQQIKRNRAKCVLCNSVIESIHKHDYVICDCGAIAIDGGKDCLKRTAEKIEYIIELSEYEEYDANI